MLGLVLELGATFLGGNCPKTIRGQTKLKVLQEGSGQIFLSQLKRPESRFKHS